MGSVQRGRGRGKARDTAETPSATTDFAAESKISGVITKRKRKASVLLDGTFVCVVVLR